MQHYDAIIVGSGPGGALAAEGLVRSGARVLMLERGNWVTRGPENHLPSAVAMLSPHYSTATPYLADTDEGKKDAGAFYCVGGQSVFYAGVAFRYREQDFKPLEGIPAEHAGVWPFDYAELEPYYQRAEEALGVSGTSGIDPTEPHRSRPFPQRSPELSSTGDRLHAAARSLGLRPFPPPLAVMRAGGPRAACVSCGACNGFACAVSAKGDASVVVSGLLPLGLEVRTQAAAARILSEGVRATGIEYLDLATQTTHRVFADSVILAAGALATPHLLLSSGAQWQNPGGRVVGRYLMRHANAVVVGLFRNAPGGGRMSYKELAVQDFYFGDPSRPDLGGLGSIQQEALPAAMVEREAPAMLRPFARALLSHLAALIIMTEDEPSWSNRVSLDRSVVSALGTPGMRVHHRYARRDLDKRQALIGHAKRILRAAGSVAAISRSIDTFSHALGTVRMGVDPATSALDGDGRFRGFTNLYVADASALPTSAAVNPTLTIAAHALRLASRLAAGERTVEQQVRREREGAVVAFA